MQKSAYKIYQVDAFTHQIFGGNPAAVCPLKSWLSKDLMQQIALENNLAETAFYMKEDRQYHIRWFTPKAEVALCGHATLATAFVIFNFENFTGHTIEFQTQSSGKISVSQSDGLLSLNFPTDLLKEIDIINNLSDSFNFAPTSIYKGLSDLLFVFENEDQIQNLAPNLTHIAQLNCRGVIVTAKGKSVDFVSRFFTPQLGVNEDPVTGSAHTTLIPYWAKRLNQNKFTAIQLSERRGYLECELLGDRVKISGEAKLYLEGNIFLE